jgi:hypothetical protein
VPTLKASGPSGPGGLPRRIRLPQSVSAIDEDDVALVATFWLVGLCCLIAALAGKGVKIGSVEVPAFGAWSTRVGASVLGIVALLMGGVILLVQQEGGGATTPRPASAPGGPTVSGPAPAGATNSGTTNSGTTNSGATNAAGTSDGGGAVLDRATILLANGTGVDIGVPSPEVQHTFIGTSFYYFQGEIKSGGDNFLSEWTGSAAPTARDCVNQLRTQPLSTLPPRAGLRFCARGYQTQRIAYLQVSDFDAANSTARIDVVLWDLSA